MPGTQTEEQGRHLHEAGPQVAEEMDDPGSYANEQPVCLPRRAVPARVSEGHLSYDALGLQEEGQDVPRHPAAGFQAQEALVPVQHDCPKMHHPHLLPWPAR